MANIYDKILKDARVKLTSMFDNNFRQQGFFGEKWASTRISKINKAGKKGSILINTGQMRRSIRALIRGNAIIFNSDRPYTSLHNEGGNFVSTVRKHSRMVNGKSYNVKSHQRVMTMPQRQFIGDHTEVQNALGEIVNRNLQRFSEDLVKKSMK